MKVINKRKVGGFEEATPIDVKSEINQVTEGIYQGFIPVPSKKYAGKINNLYFMTIDGKKCSFFGGTLLDRRLEHVEIGEWLELTYKGKQQNPKTGNSYHDFAVIAGELVEGNEDNVTPKVTKPKQPNKVTKAQEANEGEDEEGDDIPF